MKSSIGIILLFSILILFSQFNLVNGNIENKNKEKDQSENQSFNKPEKLDIIELQSYNHVSIMGQIDQGTSSKFIKDILKIKADKIYIYLSTPGGSVLAGNDIIQIIDTLAQIGKDIVCIADVANSMGFSILQACPTRYVTPNSVIMQHQMSLGLEGALENVKNRIKLITVLETKQLDRQSKRVQLTVEEFKAKTLSDWWMHGSDAVNEKAADKSILATCNKDLLNKTYMIKKYTIFGPIHIEYSSCPLIKQPLSVKIMKKSEDNKENNKLFNKMIEKKIEYIIN